MGETHVDGDGADGEKRHQPGGGRKQLANDDPAASSEAAPLPVRKGSPNITVSKRKEQQRKPTYRRHPTHQERFRQAPRATLQRPVVLPNEGDEIRSRCQRGDEPQRGSSPPQAGG